MPRWKRTVRTGLVALLALLVLGAMVEQLARWVTARRFPLPGRWIVVGDHRLHLTAQGAGHPVVVFEAGLDTGGALAWTSVQQQVARFSCAVSYDRAGVLGSERGTGAKTGAVIAQELHAALHQAGYTGPYVLVGHSLGGILLRSFVARYPQEVGGVVLVDASHPDQLQRFPTVHTALPPMPAPWLVDLIGRTGLIRLFGYPVYPGTAPADQLNRVNQAYLATSLAAAVEEQHQFPALLAEARRRPAFGSISLVVITGTSPTRNSEYADPVLRQRVTDAWRAMQRDLLRLSTHSRQVLATRSGHYVQLQQPAVVTAAVQELVEQLRPVRKSAYHHNKVPIPIRDVPARSFSTLAGK